MKVLITAICGFVGNALARRIKDADPSNEVFGVDNLKRSGSGDESTLNQAGIGVFHGDICSASDVEALPAADWVIDDGRTETFR
jgi:CDP-paratose 2-epimerase